MSLSKIIYFLWVQNILKSVLSTLGSYFWSLRLQHLESVLKYRLLGHTSRISNSLGLWWGRGTCISYIFFCVWFLLLYMKSVRFIHVALWISISFLLIALWCSMRMYGLVWQLNDVIKDPDSFLTTSLCQLSFFMDTTLSSHGTIYSMQRGYI